ncbi:MAG: SRPBCC domain-containing protein [Saprospiraceae bacterium]|nr:SRPBCC domain-containing protein [Saprospiraceae bacterium]
MKKIKTEIVIDKDISSVWNVLTDFEDYPNWNPFVRSVIGEKSIGNKVSVTCNTAGGKTVSFKPIVIMFETDREFRWKGKLGIKGIFDGQHYFKLEKVSENQTKFIHGENMSGVLVSLLGKTLNKMNVSFESMNQALKKECEKIKNSYIIDK